MWLKGASAYLKEWRKRNPDKTREYHQNYNHRHPNAGNEQVKNYRRLAKIECIAHYSNSANKCACCGENNFEFLAIDHIDGGGRKAQRERGHGNIHQWLKARGYPEGFRVLCHNCNMSLGFYGYCPHGGFIENPINR